MSESVLHGEPSAAPQFDALRDLITAAFEEPSPAYLVGADGQRIELPRSAFEALKLVFDSMARGQSLTLIPHDNELSTQEAADLLHVSRPFLIKLLDRGELPFHRVGTHRRLRMEDVAAYQERRDAERKAALEELTRLSEELPGGYR